MTRSFFVTVLIIAAFAFVACSRRTVKMVPAASVPAAQAQAKIGSDDNGNTVVQIEAEHLANPARLTPPATAYVIWFQQPGQVAQNQGVLRVGDDLKGEFKTVTPFRTFQLFITAEGDPMASSPTGARVLDQYVSR